MCKELEYILTRSSVRKYEQKPIEKETLLLLVKAGMAAPSAVNAQPWAFIIIDDSSLLKEFGNAIPTSSMVKNAPAAILVCGDLKKAREGWLQQYWIQDCSAATQNILLAAHAMGLGAVWTSVYPAEDRLSIVAKALNLPDHIVPLNIIPLGYPAETPKAKDKWKPDAVFWNKEVQ